MLLPRPKTLVIRRTAPFLLAALIGTGCFKTLDESLMDTKGSGGTGGGGTGGTGAGGSGASGGTGGTGAGGTGATGGTGGDSGADVPVEAGIVPYDAKKYPVGNIGTGTPPVIIAADDLSVFRTTKNKQDATLVAQLLAGGSGVTLPTVERPEAMSAAPGGQYLFVAAGNNTTAEGSLARIPKAGGAKDPITANPAIELAKGIFAAPDNFVYVSAQAMAPNTVGVLRFGNVATLTETLYTATAGNESGGDILVAAGCAYWVSNGGVWVMPTSGGSRSPALKTQSTDAVGVAADAKNLYFTRSDGSVWRRALSSTACDGAGPNEAMLASGFETIGDVIAYDDQIAWTAMGDKGNGYAGGGVFTMPGAGGTITQIAPAELGPTDIEQSPTFVVYATDVGSVRRVPKKAQ